jgi:hypothetical protein
MFVVLPLQIQNWFGPQSDMILFALCAACCLWLIICFLKYGAGIRSALPAVLPDRPQDTSEACSRWNCERGGEGMIRNVHVLYSQTRRLPDMLDSLSASVSFASSQPP